MLLSIFKLYAQKIKIDGIKNSSLSFLTVRSFCLRWESPRGERIASAARRLWRTILGGLQSPRGERIASYNDVMTSEKRINVTVPERGADCIAQRQCPATAADGYSPREGSGLHRHSVNT